MFQFQTSSVLCSAAQWVVSLSHSAARQVTEPDLVSRCWTRLGLWSFTAEPPTFMILWLYIFPLMIILMFLTLDLCMIILTADIFIPLFCPLVTFSGFIWEADVCLLLTWRCWKCFYWDQETYKSQLVTGLFQVSIIIDSSGFVQYTSSFTTLDYWKPIKPAGASLKQVWEVLNMNLFKFRFHFLLLCEIKHEWNFKFQMDLL